MSRISKGTISRNAKHSPNSFNFARKLTNVPLMMSVVILVMSLELSLVALKQMSYFVNLKNNPQRNVIFCQSKEQPTKKCHILSI